MKFLIIVLFVFPLCYSIEVKFRDFSGLPYKAIQKIEIPSCEAEPCVLKHGTSLPVKVTFNAVSSNNFKYGDITDAFVRVWVNYFRGKYQHDFARYDSLCVNQLTQCPIVANQSYATDVHLFLPRENIIPGSDGWTPEIGLLDFYLDIGLTETNGREDTGIAVFKLDVQN